MTVTFQVGRDGRVLTRWNGRIAFPTWSGPQPRAGQTWEAVAARTNPKETVFFLTLAPAPSSEQAVSQEQLKKLRSVFEQRRLDWLARSAHH
jgi:hypothetical protein